MSSVLLMYEKILVPKIRTFLKSTYKTDEAEINFRMAEKIIKESNPALIVVFAEELSSSEVLELQRIILLAKNSKLCIIASENECRQYQKSITEGRVYCIKTPLSDFRLLAEIQVTAMSIRDLSAAESKEEKPKPHILLVDDDPVCIRTMMGWLKGFYKVSVAKGGQDCLSCLEKQKPNLVLLDYEMPDMNGVQTLEKIRQNEEHAGLPVIFLTGVTDRGKVQEAIKCKPQGYVLKDTKIVDFFEKINSVIYS